MDRRTLARHRFTGGGRFARTSPEGGGGGSGAGTEGAGATGTETGSAGAGTGTGTEAGKFTDPETGESYGFPGETALAEMTPDQRAEYWRHKAQKHEKRANARSDYDAVKAKADQFDELQRQQMTPSDRAIAEAKEAARAEERAAQAPRLVRAEFRAAAVGRTVNGQPLDLDALLEDVDLTKYLKDDGDVDTAKVTSRLDKLAPAGPNGGQGGGGNNGGGQQQRHGAGGRRGTEGGKPDVTDTRNSMERALGRRPKANASV